MKKYSLLTGILTAVALTVSVTGCSNQLSVVEIDPFSLKSNYRNLRIKGMYMSGEQFTEEVREEVVDGEVKELKNYVIKDVKALVVPVDFSNAPYSDYGETEDSTREVLRKIIFGSKEETEWYSLSEYYKESSFGQCHVSGTVAPWWHTNIDWTTLPKETEAGKTTYLTGYSQDLAVQIQDYYRENPDEINLADYDANQDGLVDSLIMIYTAPIRTTGDLFWAFATHVGGAYGKYTPTGEYEGINAFFWASYRFLYERWNKQPGEEAQYTSAEIKAGVDVHGNTIHPDAHTLTHEYGHVLSLPDYYITDYDSSDYGGMGGLDMMDYNVGDHNAYSKMCYGWINPKRIAGTSGSVKLTLKSTTKTGDCVIIPAPGEWNDTYMDQYLLIEFLTPEGVAKADGEKQYLGSYPLYYNKAGIRILHIDSRMGLFQSTGSGNYRFAGYTWQTSTDLPQSYVGIAADNTASRSAFKSFKIAEVLPSTGKSIKYYNQSSDELLYHEGDKFGSKGVWNNFKLNDTNGGQTKKFGFKISVNKIDGYNSATITISR